MKKVRVEIEWDDGRDLTITRGDIELALKHYYILEKGFKVTEISQPSETKEIAILKEKLLAWQHETQQLKSACRAILKMDEPQPSEWCSCLLSVSERAKIKEGKEVSSD